MELADVVGRNVPRETSARLEAYANLLRAGAAKQNLISASTFDNLWNRHILDSAQLIRHAKSEMTVDIGSGAGLPGIVLAILESAPIVLIEPRRLRVEFLRQVVDELALGHVTVVHGKSIVVAQQFKVITGRAVASAAQFFALAHHLSRPDTIWLLPKGRNAQKELDEARKAWQGEFRLEPSLTDETASILIATGVRRRRGR